MEQTTEKTSWRTKNPSQRTIHVLIPIIVAIITSISTIITPIVVANIKDTEKQEAISQVRDEAENELVKVKDEEYLAGYSAGIAKAHEENTEKFLEEYNHGYSDCEAKMRGEYAKKLAEEYEHGYTDCKAKLDEEYSQKLIDAYKSGYDDRGAELSVPASDPPPSGEMNTPQKKNLSTLNPVSGTLDNKQYAKWGSTDTDNYENKYSSGIYLRQDSGTKARLIYNLDKKYSSLTGKFVLDQGSKNTNGHYTICFYSLVDGEEILLYESPQLSTATRPIDISVPVSDVADLVVEVFDPKKTGNWCYDQAWCGFVNAILE